jgi:hypothetical protein
MAFLDATLLISFVEYHPPQSSLEGGGKKQLSKNESPTDKLS